MSLVIVIPLLRILKWFSILFSVKNGNSYSGQRSFFIWCPINSLTFLSLAGLLLRWSLCCSSNMPRPAFTPSSLQVSFPVSEMLFLSCLSYMSLITCLFLREVHLDPLLSCSWSPLPCAAFSFFIVHIIISTHYILYLFNMATSFCFPMLAY